MEFSLHVQEDEPCVEGVSQLQYIGRTLELTDNDCLSVHHNIVKAQASWKRFKNML